MPRNVVSVRLSRRVLAATLFGVALAMVLAVGLPGATPGAAADSVSPLCPSEGDSQQYEWASRLKIGHGETYAGVTGYHDATATPLLTVQAGQTYDVEIDAHTDGALYEQFFGIWLDLDQDLTIEPDPVPDGERVLTIPDVPVQTFERVHGQITIPSDAYNGIMYGRMIMEFSSNPVLCGTYPYGTTIDFRLQIEGGQDNPDQQTLTVDPGSGTVVSNPPGIDTANGDVSAAFNIGQEVTLTATPEDELIFQSWSGAVSDTANPTTIVIGETAMSVTANFSKLAQSPLSLASTDTVYGTDLGLEATGGSGTGAVTYQLDDAGTAGCTLDGDQLTAGRTGSCAVVATKAGDDTYEPTSTPITTITVTPKPLTVTGLTAIDRPYDATTEIDVEGTPTLQGIVADDDVSVADTPAGATSDGDVGLDRQTTVTGLSLDGVDAGNYTLEQPTLQVTISPRVLDVVGGRVYDGTATLAADVLSLAGLVDGQTLGLSGAATVPAKDADHGVAVDVSGLALGDTADGSAGNYQLAGGTHVATITTRPLTLSGFTVADRVYDATTQVVGAGFEDDRVEGDDLEVDATVSFDVKDAGQDRTVTFDGFTVTGKDADNYHLGTVDGTTTATIHPAALTVSETVVTHRAYDGTDVVALTGSQIQDVHGNDDVVLAGADTATSASTDVGTHPLTTTMTLDGVDAGNYTLEQPTLQVTISRAKLNVDPVKVEPRTFDGTTTAAIGQATLKGVVDGDDVMLTGHTQGRFATPDAGTNLPVTTKMGLSGADVSNYMLVQPTVTGTILPAAATLTIASPTVKTVDSNPASIKVTTDPAGIDGVRTSFLTSVLPPTTAGIYPYIVRLENPNYTAEPITGYYVIGATGTGTAPLPPRNAPVVSHDGQPLKPAPGNVIGVTNGQLATPTTTASDDSVRIQIGDTSLRITGAGADGQALALGHGAALRVTTGGTVVVSGEGFLAGSNVELWLFSEPFYLGTAPVDPDGTFSASFSLPENITVGEHTLQANGTGNDGASHSTSLGILVEDEPQPEPEIVPVTETSSEPLPNTGAAASNLLLASLLALLAGSALLATTHRRRRLKPSPHHA